MGEREGGKRQVLSIFLLLPRPAPARPPPATPAPAPPAPPLLAATPGSPPPLPPPRSKARFLVLLRMKVRLR